VAEKPGGYVSTTVRLDPVRVIDEGYYAFSGNGTLLPVIVGVVPQSVASLMPASWNQIGSWLQQIDGLRRSSFSAGRRFSTRASEG
jgi:hypothetical protein